MQYVQMFKGREYDFMGVLSELVFKGLLKCDMVMIYFKKAKT